LTGLPLVSLSVTDSQFNIFDNTLKSSSGLVTYSPVTSTVVPTPALLPGLVGMGFAAIRKRRQAEVA
jgi:hypothetical protein